ncbi:uncharacterized [Lates japonicus]
MNLKDATSCGRCAGTRRCRRGKRPQSHWALICRPASPFCFRADWTAVLLLDSPREGRGGGGGAHCPGHVQCFFSLLTQTQVTVSMLAEQEVCFSDLTDDAKVIACVLAV